MQVFKIFLLWSFYKSVLPGDINDTTRYDTLFNVEFSLSKINWFSGDPLSNNALKTELKIRWQQQLNTKKYIQ